MLSLLAGCASPTLVALDETWFACTRKRQCEVFEDPTCTLIPINKRYAEPFAQHVRIDESSAIAKGPCPKPLVRYKPACEDGRCTSELRGLARRRPEPLPAKSGR